jgi:hypothetical protein
MILESTITLGKANVVADALSRRSHVNHVVVKSIPSELCNEFNKVKLKDHG